MKIHKLDMLLRTMKIIKEGYTISIPLPEECGYTGYSVKCTYKYNEDIGKYYLSLWLRREDIDDDFRIDAQEIDAQYIRGTRRTINNNIKRIIADASLSEYFEKYIKRFENTYACFERGDELSEKESHSGTDNDDEA